MQVTLVDNCKKSMKQKTASSIVWSFLWHYTIICMGVRAKLVHVSPWRQMQEGVRMHCAAHVRSCVCLFVFQCFQNMAIGLNGHVVYVQCYILRKCEGHVTPSFKTLRTTLCLLCYIIWVRYTLLYSHGHLSWHTQVQLRTVNLNAAHSREGEIITLKSVRRVVLCNKLCWLS